MFPHPKIVYAILFSVELSLTIGTRTTEKHLTLNSKRWTLYLWKKKHEWWQ